MTDDRGAIMKPNLKRTNADWAKNMKLSSAERAGMSPPATRNPSCAYLPAASHELGEIRLMKDFCRFAEDIWD